MRHEFLRSERTEEEKKAIANGEADENGQYNLNFDKKIETKEPSLTEEKSEIKMRPSTEEELEEDELAKQAENRRIYKLNSYKSAEQGYLEKKGENIAKAIEISKGLQKKIREVIGQEFYNVYHTNSQVNVDNPSMREIKKRAEKTREQYPQYEPVLNILLHIKAYNNIKKCIEELEFDKIEDFFQRVKSINSNVNDFSFFIKGQSEWSELLDTLNLNTKNK